MWALSITWAGLLPASAQSQMPAPGGSDANTRAEGYVLDQSDSTLYHFRVRADSTVYLRRGRSAGDTLAIPAQTLATIYESARKHGIGDRQLERAFSLRYEDQIFEARVAERISFVLLGGLSLLLLSGGGALGWLWWRLSREQSRSESLDQSRRLLAEGREKERRRLAREIHDGPVQDLHGLHMHLTTLKGTENGEDIEGMEDELMRVTSELRSMSADLHPPELNRFGLAAALSSHADRLQSRYPSDSTITVEVDGESDGEMDELSRSSALALFRIAQEATTNAVQHADADQVVVDLQKNDDLVTLEVRDDGQGFTPPDDWHDQKQENSYGLFSMRERADAIGATLDLETTPGAGTRVRVSLALS